MLRFIIRRLIGAIAVLFAISILVFLIFNVVPATNPAQRIAGKNATPQLIKNVEEEWGFDKSLPEQYWTQMKLIFTGKATSYSLAHINIDKRILEGIPATASLCIGAAIIWLAFGDHLRLHIGDQGRWVHRPLPHRDRADRDLDAGLLAGLDPPLLPHLQDRTLPRRAGTSPCRTRANGSAT